MLRYIVPTVILFIYILVIIINASSTAKGDGRSYAEDKLQAYDKSVAEMLTFDLSAIQNAVEADASMIGNSDDDGKAMPLINRLIEENKVTEGYVIDGDGKATDVSGKETDVSGKEWYALAKEGTSDGRSTVTDALLEGEDYMITIAAPSPDGKGLAAVRLSSDFFRNIPSIAEFDGKTQFLFLQSDGTVLSAVGGRGLFKGGNIFDGTLLFTEIDSLESLKKSISGDHNGTVYCTALGEEKAFIYRYVKYNGWKVCELATESYIDSVIAGYFAPTKGVFIKITIALIIFLAFIVVMNIIIRMLYKKDQKKLKSKAETDLLTGVLNKISTEQTIQDYLDMVGEEEPGMFMLFDIDNFKNINDTRGHAFGDEVLAAIGKELPTIYRTTDIVGRLGGDEFCVFLKDIPNENARIHMGEVTYNFFRDFKVGEYSKYDVTASIGAAMFPKDGKDFEELYKSADKAVYAAKEHGRNRLVFFGEEVD